MKRVNLTDTWLRANNGKQTEKEVSKSDGGGLEARLRNGVIAFNYRPQLKNGKRIKMTLGRYPSMSLADARAAVVKYRAVVAKGGDPRKTQKAEIVQEGTEPTLNDVYDYWYDNYCEPNRTNPERIKKNYQTHMGAKFGEHYYKDLARHSIVQHLMSRAKKSPNMVGKVLGEVKQAIRYAIDHDYLKHPHIIDTLRGSHLGVTRGVKQRTLDEKEIKLVLDAADACSWHERNMIIVKLLMFYGCRSGELRQTQMSWLDFDKMVWTVPAEYHKTGKQTGRPLKRPITEEVLPLWQRAIAISQGDYVFTKIEGKVNVTEKPFTVSGMLNVSFSLMRWMNSQDDKTLWPAVEAFSNHDFRRTARTYWAKFGEWSVCERMMGHKLPGEADVYDKHDYVEMMRPIYKQWWTELQRIQFGGENVVSMRA